MNDITTQRILWAKSHDWFVQAFTNSQGQTVVEMLNPFRDEGGLSIYHTAFSSLYLAAGY